MVGVAFLFSCLVGLRRAAWLAGGLVVAMEGSQTGFGYGFDVDDFIDLVSGAVGIALGGALFILESAVGKRMRGASGVK